MGYSPGCSDSDPGVEHPQKPEQLLAVLQVFGQALLQQDLNIFRISLAALEDLNSKWKLYHKVRNHKKIEIKTLIIFNMKYNYFTIFISTTDNLLWCYNNS